MVLQMTSGVRICFWFFVVYSAKLYCLDAELRALFGSSEPGQGWGMQFLGAQICELTIGVGVCCSFGENFTCTAS